MLTEGYNAKRVGQIRDELQQDYTELYRFSLHDSAHSQRASMIKRLRDCTTTKQLKERGGKGNLLDLGSGPQPLESEYPGFSKTDPRPFPYTVYTVDYAEIQASRLMGKKLTKQVFHSRAEGSYLPFSDSSFDIVISNMALDFMPPRTLLELKRVLRQRGRVLLNLHSPKRINEWINKYEAYSNPTHSQVVTLAFWKYLRDCHVLFESEEQIQKYFARAGFAVEMVKLAKDNVEKHMPGVGEIWWEVDLVKL